MVGLFFQQHYLPFYPGCYAENERFQASKAEAMATQWFKNGKFEEPNKGKISGLSDFIKSMKSDQGNATVPEVQELISASKILSLKWKNSTCITLVLADGTIIYIRVKNLFTNEYFCVVDKFFRFPEPALNVAYSDRHVLFMFPDNRLLLMRKDVPGEEQTKSSDLIQPEVTVNHYNDLLPSMVSRRIEKKLAINDKSDLFMIWWSGSKDDVFPWSPKPEQRANILIYSLDENDPVLISYLKTDNTLLDSSFIPAKFNHVCTLEQSCDSQGNIIVNEVIHEITRGKLTAICETAIPLQSELKCYSYEIEKHQKLALGCCDSSIVVYTQDGKVTHYTKASFIPCNVTWHNDGYLVLVAGDRGQFQVFDIALSPLLLLDPFDSSPSLTKELIPPLPIDHLSWCPLQPSSTDSCLLVRFEAGAMVILRFAIGRVKLTNLCSFHLTNDHYPEAVKVLKSIYWNTDECLNVMYQIFTFLMQQKHSDDVEYNLEHLLATYFVPSVQIEETLRKRHAKPMRVLARKFFMWLVRAKKFSRALQIAISLGEEGLLRKLHAIAFACGDLNVASEVNKRLQPSIHSSSDSRTSSPSNSESCSSCDTSTETSEIEIEPMRPVTVTIPRPDLLVLEPPSPYRNPTTEPPIDKSFYFGERTSAGSSLVENALISEASGEVVNLSKKIEVIHFGQV